MNDENIPLPSKEDLVATVAVIAVHRLGDRITYTQDEYEAVIGTGMTSRYDPVTNTVTVELVRP